MRRFTIALSYTCGNAICNCVNCANASSCGGGAAVPTEIQTAMMRYCSSTDVLNATLYQVRPYSSFSDAIMRTTFTCSQLCICMLTASRPLNNTGLFASSPSKRFAFLSQLFLFVTTITRIPIIPTYTLLLPTLLFSAW